VTGGQSRYRGRGRRATVGVSERRG